MRGINGKSVLRRAAVALIAGLIYGWLFATYVKPRFWTPRALAEENMMLFALRHSPMAHTLAVLAVPAIVAIHCGLVGRARRNRSAAEKMAAAAVSFAACLLATLVSMRVVGVK